MELTGEALRGYLDYLRDLGIYELYRGQAASDPQIQAQVDALVRTLPASITTASPMRVQPAAAVTASGPAQVPRPHAAPASAPQPLRSRSGPEIVIAPAAPIACRRLRSKTRSLILIQGRLQHLPCHLSASTTLLHCRLSVSLPTVKPDALQALRQHIGDCTRCPLAYAGRHTIVFADGDPNASLMFVGEGPGADEDASGVPFVGKAGQLLNNMIGAMGLKRESVYIANIVKCRPPKNRVPEPVEANTCSQFLLQQIDIVQPKVIVALGATAAMYLLGVKQSLTTLRGQWHDVRGAKCAVTYHPAFLLRDPRQKGEAWKDLQRVMVELNLKPPARV